MFPNELPQFTQHRTHVRVPITVPGNRPTIIAQQFDRKFPYTLRNYDASTGRDRGVSIKPTIYPARGVDGTRTPAYRDT